MDAKQLAKIREDYKVHPTVTHVYIPELLDYVHELEAHVEVLGSQLAIEIGSHDL